MFKFDSSDIKLILRNFGEVTFYFSFVMLIPIIIALIYGEGIAGIIPFLLSTVICLAIGFFFKTAFKTHRHTKDIHAFCAIILIWIIIPLLGALPFILYENVGIVDSYFESTSALTTTGLSMFENIQLPNSLVFWRSLESWIGGAGIVVLALVGILRYMKGYKLFEAEGREERLKPHILNTVKRIWWIYTALTIFGIILLMAANLPLFKAANFSMSAISTTGMGTYYGELVAMDNIGVEIGLGIIMMLGAFSFYIHYRFLRGKLSAYVKDIQIRVMLLFIIISIIILMPKLLTLYGPEAARHSSFTVVSAITAGGFQSVEMASWDAASKFLIATLMIIGGCAGSTAGGLKIIRVWVFIKSLWWKAKEAVLPENAYFSKKIAGKRVEDREINIVYIFILLYIIFLVLGTFVISYTDASYKTEDVFFEVTSAQGNAGLTAGITSPGMHVSAKLMLIGNMIIGRIEIIPILFGIGFLFNIKRRHR